MRMILNDLKNIFGMICFSIVYSYIFNKNFNIVDSINILLIFTFSIYICGVIITYKFKKIYINNFYQHMTIAFLGIGIDSFSYYNIMTMRYDDIYFWEKITQMNLIYSLFWSLCLLWAIKNRRKNINFNIGLIVITVVSMLIAYIALNLEFDFLKIYGQSLRWRILGNGLEISSIIFMSYILSRLRKMKHELSDCFYIYINIFLISRIFIQFTGLLKIEFLDLSLILFECSLFVVEIYSIIKIMITEIIINPYTTIYQKLDKKTVTFEGVIKKLSSAIHEKEKISQDYNKTKREDELKNELLTNISHEFKTPVNVIYAAVQTQELLQNTENSDKCAKYNDIIKQNCNRLTRLINNFIDTTKFHKGNMIADLRCVNIVALTERIIDSVIPYAENKNLNVIFDASDEELYTMVDVRLYDRLILNLLSNSIKYNNDNGNIKVYIYNCYDSICISVKDDGIGIKKENMDMIFERFERLDKSFSRTTEGSGLGLHIVKGIIELLQGTIEIESEEGSGTEVIVKFVRYKRPSDEEIFDEKIFDEEVDVLINHEVKVEMSDIYM